MKALFRLSEKLGLVPTVLGVLSYLVCAALVVKAGTEALWQYPILALIFFAVVAALAGMGGLVGFWLVANLLEYRSLGYRVRCTVENEWFYEERNTEGVEQCIPISREVLATGYPAPCAVRILSEVAWESQAPKWAQGRRAEILERIAKCFGAEQGGSVQFLDQ